METSQIKNTRTPVLWMAGDSTMQSYPEEKRPQWGWGERFLERVEEQLGVVAGVVECFHREDCPFDTQKRYIGQYFELDNCAMAGRSSKTFREEKRLQDIAEHILPGDYLLIQFGHNDAGKGKPERYVALEDFKESLYHYVQVAREHQATPMFLSSIALCPGSVIQGEAEEIQQLLPSYAEKMCEYAKELGIPYIDMGKITKECLSCKTEEQAESLYLPDHVHLVYEGADQYALLAAKEFTKHLPKV